MPAELKALQNEGENTTELAQRYNEANTVLDELAKLRSTEVSDIADQVAKVSGVSTDAGRAVVERLEQKQSEKEREAKMTEEAKDRVSGIVELAQKMCDEINDQQGTIGDLRASLDVKHEMVTSLESAVTERDDELKKLQKELEKNKDELSDVQAKLDDKGEALNDAQKDFKDLDQEFKTAKDEHTASLKEAEKTALSAAIASDEAKEEASKATEKAFDDAKQAADETEKKTAAEKDALEQKYTQLEDEKEALKKKLGKTDGENFLLGDTVKTLQSDLKKAENELEVKERSNSARDQENKLERERAANEKKQFEELLLKKSGTINELQELIEVLSGNKDAIISTIPAVVSLPGGPIKKDLAQEVLLPEDLAQEDENTTSDDDESMPGPNDNVDSGSWADSVADPVEVGDTSKDAFWESGRAGDEPNAEVDFSDHPELTLEMVVKATDRLDGTEWKSADEIKLAGVLAHQAWRVEEVAKLTRLDAELVREKLTDFARRGLISVVK